MGGIILLYKVENVCSECVMSRENDVDVFKSLYTNTTSEITAHNPTCS